MNPADPLQSAVARGVAAFSLAVFLPFGWAIRGHFVKREQLPLGMRLLTAASVAGYGCMFLVLSLRDRPPSVERALVAAVLMALAGALFWWAIATTRSRRLHLAHSGDWPDHVQSTGPFRWIRHPFYTAYMAFWVGTAALAGSWQWLPVCSLVVWYLLVARSEEQRFLTSASAAAYTAYRGRTGMVMPQWQSFFRRDRC